MIKLLLVFFLLITGPFLEAKETSRQLVCFSGGDYNVFHTRSSKNTVVFQLEYKGTDFFTSKYVNLRPFGAAMLNLQASLWLGGGINFDLFHHTPFVITLGLGPGYFAKGHGKNLGYPLEVRSSIDVAYRLKSEARVGFQFYHLSNASFSQKNPGVENLLLFYGLPF